MKKIISIMILCIVMIVTNNNVNADCQKTIIENTKNTKGKIVKQIVKKYKGFDAAKNVCIYYNASQAKYAYYNNGVVSTYSLIKYDSNSKMTYNYYRINYSNGKIKQHILYTNFTNNVYKKSIMNKYNTKAKKTFGEYVYRSSNKNRTLVKRYYFNKAGQLKSNKYGKALRVQYYYFSNNKISKRYIQDYNSKGKLINLRTKYYPSNRPITFGDRLVSAGKSYNNYNMVCSELVANALFKAGFKNEVKVDENGVNALPKYHYGLVNGHKYVAAYYQPNFYSKSKVLVVKDTNEHKEAVAVYGASKLIVVKDQKELIKQLRIGDILIYKRDKKYYNAHDAIYMGNNQAIQGGLADKNGKYQKVGVAPLNLGAGLELYMAYRVSN